MFLHIPFSVKAAIYQHGTSCTNYI